MEDRPTGRTPILPPGGLETAVLAELVACENLAQTAAWAARWCSAGAGAEAAVVWAPDPVQPVYLCAGVHGPGTRPFLRRTAGRDEGAVLRLLRGREAIAFHRKELSGSNDPFLAGAPDWAAALLALPLEAEVGVSFLLGLFYREPKAMEAAIEGLGPAARTAAGALVRSLRAERKSVGMLHAIERLTNLYDLSKAFASTLDASTLSDIIAHKAVDFTAAETGSLWFLDETTGEVILSRTVVNENYEVDTPPDAVGSQLVGEVVSDRVALRKNGLPSDNPAANEEPGYAVRSLLGAPLVDEDEVEGAIIVANKRGRRPEFSEEDQELLQDLARQAIRAIRNARRYEAEKKVEELDALLAVSREITSTLDLERVMQAIVNGASALITYDRATISVLQRGKLRLGAISGTLEVDRKSAEVRRIEELLEWIYLSGSDVAVTQLPDGTLTTDRPETEEKFRTFFAESSLNAVYGVILKDDEGKLGVLGFESKAPITFDEETRDLLGILVNQATVAVRNAQLYQQVPLSGFLKPLLERQRRFAQLPVRSRRRWVAGVAAALIVLFLVPWRLRIGGPARVLPASRSVVAAAVNGIVVSIDHREGDRVKAGERIAQIEEQPYRAALAEAKAALEVSDRDLAVARQAADAGALFAAQSRHDEAAARVAYEQQTLAWTALRAPTSGVIITPRLEEKVGQVLSKGSEFCVVAEFSDHVTVEVAVDEQDSSLVRAGMPAAVKLNTFPTRTLQGEVARVGARILEDGKERFLIAEVAVPNPTGKLRTGMLGRAKVRVGYRNIATLLVRKPARWIWSKIWPLLP